jgi:hypothetical protein
MPEEIVTEVVVLNPGQPPIAGSVYRTVYVPNELVFGVMAPVAALIVKPAGVAE